MELAADTIQTLVIADAAPDLPSLHARHPQRYPALLDSVAHNPETGRYSILFAFPGAALWLDHDGGLWRGDAPVPGLSFLQALDAAYAPDTVLRTTSLPFCGGHFVFLAYEFLAQLEAIELPRGDSHLPVAFAWPIPAAIIVDHRQGTCTLMARGQDAEAMIAQMREDLATLPAPAAPQAVHLLALHEDPAADFLAGVARVLRYIHDGDVFQVNFSRQWRAEVAHTDSPVDLYRHLRRCNPAPFAGFFAWQDEYVLSSSPERLLALRDGVLQSRPIAGTRPRSDNDSAMIDELIGHPKERAEHIMLVDLIRNDLGRVCQPGSIVVDELLGIESYQHVHHIVSNVLGRLQAGTTPGQILAALFPGGTITGCPKVRCMQIIAALEGSARGAYTGSMGYISRDGQMDFNILIRSLHWRPDGVVFRAGAGIVADSLADAELQETRSKAKGLLRALGVTDGHLD